MVATPQVGYMACAAITLLSTAGAGSPATAGVDASSVDILWGGESMRVLAGEVVVIVGRPRMGKTYLACDIARRASLAGNRVIVCNVDPAVNDIAGRMRASAALSPEPSCALIEPATSKANERGRLELVEDHFATPLHVESAISAAAERLGGVELIIIDGFGRPRLTNESKAGATLRGGRALQDIRRVARQLGAALVVTCHATRHAMRRAGHRPKPADIRGGKTMLSGVDRVIAVSRPAVYDEPSSDENSRVVERIAYLRSRGGWNVERVHAIAEAPEPKV